ncbi:glutamine--tRNA ligase [Dioscorea cayenensis subsp. rotundata]|uniref:Glutaminyl-tRNA synthetase n=1 Tax=Dioscorea cayennensis subsp. rotundata TaxID=55577 RepID=A0AB40C3C5_DIOCR|nr:glutamine--tRNA ligase [Dioscorea cayenensis subsp. rotundata]
MVVREGENNGPPPRDLFIAISLDQKMVENTFANNKVTSNLTTVIKQAGVTNGWSKDVGNLLYRVATEYSSSAASTHRPILLEYVVSSKIKKVTQLDGAFSLLVKVGVSSFDLKEFEEAYGVGVDVSVEEIESTVNVVLDGNMNAILEQLHSINVGKLCGEVRKLQPWVDAKIVKDMIDGKLRQLLGEKTESDNKMLLKEKKEKPAKPKDKSKPLVDSAFPTEAEINPFLIFPQPEENYKVHTEIIYSDGRPKLSAQNTMDLLKAHLEKTGGIVLTRFPPEPNGYLHIGHAKAMFIDFSLARERNGSCYLRFDDTNPEAEKREYIDHIQEIVQWLGWKPFKVTYTSDYFKELYDLAVKLIEKDLAYVDHQLPEEIKEYREKKMNSPWRDRPVSESLKLFDDMRRGLIDEGKATLRLKQDMQSDNKNMYDLIAYRIKFTPHPHDGDKWCIYPSYDYAHCIVDSLENITHSLSFPFANLS